MLAKYRALIAASQIVDQIQSYYRGNDIENRIATYMNYQKLRIQGCEL